MANLKCISLSTLKVWASILIALHQGVSIGGGRTASQIGRVAEEERGARILRHGPAPLSSPYPDFADTSHPHTQPQGSRLLHPSRSTSNIRTCLRSLCTRQALLRQKLYVSSRPSRSPHQPSRARSANAPARLQHLLAADLGQSSSHPSRTFGADIASHLNFCISSFKTEL